jgi:predicted aspartyl protease
MSIRSTLMVLPLALAASCAHVEELPVPEAGGVVRIPIVLDQNMAWVDARVGGRPMRLLLDTGGFDAVSLVPGAMNDLPVTWTGRTRTIFSAMGESERAREYVLPEFELGGIVFPEVKGFEDLLQGKQHAAARSGYLGLGLLRRFRIIIDYPSRLLVLIWPEVATPAEYDVEKWPGLLFAPQSDGIVSKGKIEGVDRLLVWDTGASHCVLKSGLEGAARVRTEGGHPFVTVNSFEVGGLEAGPMEFALLAYKQPRADGFVGYAFFAKHAVYVDFRNRLFAIRP